VVGEGSPVAAVGVVGAATAVAVARAAVAAPVLVKLMLQVPLLLLPSHNVYSIQLQIEFNDSSIFNLW
jgi:hypothetical protein